MTYPKNQDRRTFLKTSLAVTAALALPACSKLPSRKRSKPNIIVIMADDLGYSDVGCYGATAVKTPNIDRIAGEGVRFSSGYCSASTCTPTRFSLLTGKYALRQKGTGIAPPNAAALIAPGTTTLPSILKKAGYTTAVIGKWHLGLGEKSGPDWNGELKPGSSDEMVCTIDFAASLAALVNQPLGETDCPDSFNVLSALLGKSNARGRDHLIQQGNHTDRLALRSGNWKLISRRGNTYELYNLDEVPGETTNLIDTQAERAEQLKTKLAALKDEGRSRP